MTKFVPNKEHSRTALIFYFHLKKTAAESYRLLGETYDEYAPSQKTCENDGFSISKLEISMLQTRNMENRPKSTKTWNCKHCWMKMIHKHKNNSQLSVSQQAVSNHLREMGKIQKVGTWIEWETDGEAQKHMWNFTRTIQKKVILAFVSLLGMKSGFFFENPKCKKIMGRPRRTIHIDRKTESLWQEDDAFCLVGTRRVWSIMSYWSLAKWLILNAINNNWSIWTVHCLKNDQNTKRDNTKSFFSMTMLHHIQQNQFGTRWKHSAGKFYPMRLNSSDLAPSDYHLFASLGHALAEQRFGSYEDVKKWLAAKGEDF